MLRVQLRKQNMAEADLDAVIRQLAKQQNKALMAAAKSRRDRYAGLAAKAQNKEAGKNTKQTAKNPRRRGAAPAKCWQFPANNAADSSARSMRRAAEAAP